MVERSVPGFTPYDDGTVDYAESAPPAYEEITLETLAFRVSAVAAKQDAMAQTLDAILSKFDGIASEVGPVVDAISTHPLFKMIGGKANGR